jgi:hypothetical protein
LDGCEQTFGHGVIADLSAVFEFEPFAVCPVEVSFIGVISLYLFAGLAGFLHNKKGVVLFDDPFDLEVLVAAYDDEPEAFVHHTLVVAR